MKLTFTELAQEFHEKISVEYPEITFEQTKEIVAGPFNMLKEEMTSGKLRTVRFQFFGMFVIYPKRVLELLKRMEKNYLAGEVTQESFTRHKKVLMDYLTKKDYGNLEKED
jgi:hypothetical protein